MGIGRIFKSKKKKHTPLPLIPLKIAAPVIGAEPVQPEVVEPLIPAESIQPENESKEGAAGNAAVTSLTCNICDSTEFKPGPGGRTGLGNSLPACARCGSLERHRAHRKIFDDIRDENFKGLNALMFNGDSSLHRTWFGSFKVHYIDGIKPVDLQNIALPEAAYDVVICNYSLQRVQDYAAAFRELVRISSEKGFVFASFPNPHNRRKTVEWPLSNTKQNGNYRIFGSDIEAEMVTTLGGVGILRVVGQDPVTKSEEWAYIISRNNDLLADFSIKNRGSQMLV